jgi:hypothetical protein
MQTLSAASDANRAQQLIDKVLAPTEEEQIIPVLHPTDTHVTLPTGYLKVLSGEVVTSAEVRELNGLDEEAISRENSLGRQINAVLRRATVSIGGERATDDVLDSLLAGDREELLIAIYKVTFGNPAELPGWCAGCQEMKTVAFDLNKDIPRKVLADPVGDRRWEVTGSKGTKYLVTLPGGALQRAVAEQEGKSQAELTSLFLYHTVLSINGQQVYSPEAVKQIGLKDRRTILREIAERNPGPVLKDQTVECPDCGSEVVVSINLGAMFQQ